MSAAGRGMRSGAEEVTQRSDKLWVGVRVGRLRSVDECIEVDDEARRLELQAVEVGQRPS